MALVITGASGRLGRRAAELLLDRVPAGDVVLVSRRPETLADLAQRGATVRRGDFDEPASLADAFAGAERVLLVSADVVGQRIRQHGAAIDAARQAGATHVAYTSILNPVAGNPAVVVPEHRETERMLRDSGMAWTFLRNGLYAENLVLSGVQAMASGRLVTNVGDGHAAYVARDDCAAAGAAVLGPEHEGQVYDVTGPELVGAEDEVRLLREVTGRVVDLVEVGDEAFVAGLVDAGMPEDVAGALASFGSATREGYFDEVSPVLEELTGRAATSPRAVLDQHRAALGA